MSSTLHALPLSDRPRTRLVRQGPEVLTTAELLSIVLGSGVKGQSSLDAASEVLRFTGGSLRAMSQVPGAALRVCRGLGTARTATLQAVCELGRRYASESRPERVPVRGGRDVFEYYAPRLEDLPIEEFHLAILDGKHRIEQDVCVTRGTANGSLVHSREVFRSAIAANACAVVLVHNHPSGDPGPSAEDVAITAQLVRAGSLLGIEVIDHVIVGRGRFFSFNDEGLIA
jgi:DNA repair protein RadC